MKRVIKNVTPELTTETKNTLSQVLQNISSYLISTDDDPKKKGKSMGRGNAKNYVICAYKEAIQYSLLFNSTFDLPNFGNRIVHQEALEDIADSLAVILKAINKELLTNGRNLMKEADRIKDVFEAAKDTDIEYQIPFEEVHNYYLLRNMQKEKTQSKNKMIKSLKENK